MSMPFKKREKTQNISSILSTIYFLNRQQKEVDKTIGYFLWKNKGLRTNLLKIYKKTQVCPFHSVH